MMDNEYGIKVSERKIKMLYNHFMKIHWCALKGRTLEGQSSRKLIKYFPKNDLGLRIDENRDWVDSTAAYFSNGEAIDYEEFKANLLEIINEETERMKDG